MNSLKITPLSKIAQNVQRSKWSLGGYNGETGRGATPRINLGREKPSSDEVWDLAASGGTIVEFPNDNSRLSYLSNKEYPPQLQ